MKFAFIPGGFKPPHKGHLSLIKSLLPKVDKIYIIIGQKPRDGITAEMSKKIWKLYIKNNPKVKIIISKQSPIITMYGMIPKLIDKKRGDEVILIKSEKNISNKRFDLFDGQVLILPSIADLSSTEMRKAIENKDIKKIKKFIPEGINLDMILNILSI